MIPGIEIEWSRWGISLVRDGEEIALDVAPGHPITARDREAATDLIRRVMWSPIGRDRDQA